jgi:antitoxin (DNA-binding transcriptional repressor) of toxin-antitoxin stability system
MKVSAQYAQEHFADILSAIDTGEEVALMRPGQPSVRLILVEPAPANY